MKKAGPNSDTLPDSAHHYFPAKNICIPINFPRKFPRNTPTQGFSQKNFPGIYFLRRSGWIVDHFSTICRRWCSPKDGSSSGNVVYAELYARWKPRRASIPRERSLDKTHVTTIIQKTADNTEGLRCQSWVMKYYHGSRKREKQDRDSGVSF